MRRLALLLLAMGICLPGAAAKRVTAEQLEQTLLAAHGKPDGDLAKQLRGLELTERVSMGRLPRWEADLPGSESRQALVGLVDASAFLDPSAAEVPALETPGFATQRTIMSAAADYVSKTIPRLPNFFAMRETIRYEDRPQGYNAAGKLDAGYEPLHEVLGGTRVTVLYRDGKEVVDAGRTTRTKYPQLIDRGLSAWGVFGPILGTVLVDAGRSKLYWGRWERGADGPLAVFKYEVPKEKSEYEVKWCCFYTEQRQQVFQQIVGYRGEVAVDPSSGTILRLTVAADLGMGLPLSIANIMVEYGPVEIGGKTYICPVKSVSISRAQTSGFVYEGSFISVWPGTEKTLLNDVTFRDYHLFRGDARILAGEGAEGTEMPADAQSFQH